MAREVINKDLGKGIVNIPSDPELIPQQAAQDSLGYISLDGQIELCKGRQLVGANETANGYVKGEIFGYKADGTAVHFRKVNTKIQYFNGSTWADTITGLTSSAEYTFSRYQSVAGTFIYATGVDGIFKIHVANPGSYVAMYDAGKNFKGKSMIGTSRMFMWDLPTDKTGLYLSYIDLQDSSVYTTVTGESTAAATSGTLAFKSPTFTVTIASPGVFTSNGHGFTAGSTVVFATTGALPTGLTAGTTYYVISSGLTANAFQVSATLGGAAINTSGSQSGTHTIVDSRRTCFAVVITITATGQVFTDDRSGNLVGSLGGTGTINYTTGAWTLSTSSAGTAAYSWEMTNNKGVTDFTYSATRTAGQGNVFRQDEGGDAIQFVEIFDGKYYSMKNRSVYELDISSQAPYADLSATNLIFRRDIGLPYWRASVATGRGIIFMNTSNLDKPQLTILQKNINGDNLEPFTLANHFDFSNYVWDMCEMDTFGEFIIFSGRTSSSAINNKLFLYNIRRDTIDVLPYGAKTIVSNAGLLYIGDVQTDNVYNILSGFDDLDTVIENYWISNDERYQTESLKKVKRLRLKGLITPSQILEVYVSYDNDAYQLVGTIRGDGTYVDTSETYTIGSQGIGTSVIGGETDTIDGSFYFAELKLSSPKFRKRSIKLVATGVGYLSVTMLDDFNIHLFQQRLPTKYRTRQNVSLDGTLTDQ